MTRSKVTAATSEQETDVPGGERGQIVRLYSDVATVQVGDEQVQAPIRGRLFREDPPAVGDYVRLEKEGDTYAMAALLPRKSELARRAAGSQGQTARKQVLIANVDQVIVVLAAAQPDPVIAMLDRFLVACEANRLAALIVLNKIDLAGGESGATREGLANMLRPHIEAGYPVHYTSARTGEGLEELRGVLEGKESVLVGPSGAGKSSLLNALYPGLDLRVGRVSEAYGGKGRHTTVGGLIIQLPGDAAVADTAGLREVGLWVMQPEVLPDCFPEFRPLLDNCRFNNCAHLTEPDCAILAAVERGEIDSGRHASYTKLREEAVAMWPRW